MPYNAAPRVEDLGTRDASLGVSRQPVNTQPMHIPKVYIFAEKGKVGPQYLDLGEASISATYGDETFDPEGPYFSLNTPFAKLFAKNANNMVVHRVLGNGAKDRANVRLYLDILPTAVPLYRKNTDGSLVLDNNGDPVPVTTANGSVTTVPGYKVCWTAERVSVPYGEYVIGSASQDDKGIQTDGAGGQSHRYPIFEFAASYAGASGNNIAISLFATSRLDGVSFDSTLLSTDKLYPYGYKMFKVVDPRTNKTGMVYNRLGAVQSKFAIKKGAYSSSIEAVITPERVLRNEWVSSDPALDSGLGQVYVYQNNLDEVLQKFYDAEKNISDTYRDSVIRNTENNIHALNCFSFTSSNGSPYQTLKLVDVTGSIRLTKSGMIFLGGASDGVMTQEVLESAVVADMDAYDDILHPYQDSVSYPETVIYDPGFSLATKHSLLKFIAKRRDTSVVLSAYSVKTDYRDIASSLSVGIALKTTAELYPESVYYGTGVCRATICMGSGTLINDPYLSRVPVTYDLAHLTSLLAGNSSGKWVAGRVFDCAAHGSVVTTMEDIDITYVAVPTRETLWSVGLNYVLRRDMRDYYWPALQTVYNEDNSVLNSYFAIIGISYLHRVNWAAHREYSGILNKTPAQLEELVNGFVRKYTEGYFADVFVVTPNATVTELDAKLGTRWTLNTTLWAPKSKTVMQTTVVAADISALTNQNN